MTHRRQRSRRPLLNLGCLLAVASTSSALNLSQFQVITSNQIPKKCIRAYQTEIEGCTSNDFTNGRQCSATCVNGLQKEASLVNDACGDLNVSQRSLLGIVLSGDLIDTLCPGFQATTVTTTVQPGTTKGFSTIPTTTPVDTTTEAATTTSPETTPTSDASTSDASTTIQSTTDNPSPSTTSDDSDTSTSSSTEATSVQTTAQTTAQSTVTSEPVQTAPPDSSSSQDDAPTPFIGGSPFDPAPLRSLGAAIWSAYDSKALMATILAAIFIIR
ncbi:hypothetical protein F4819DRAFT_173763 [Hypoxylon fuscum]|nr:hypothetical protein F4819DRAFT_173763 [Hypoxylon fuscum]